MAASTGFLMALPEAASQNNLRSHDRQQLSRTLRSSSHGQISVPAMDVRVLKPQGLLPQPAAAIAAIATAAAAPTAAKHGISVDHSGDLGSTAATAAAAPAPVLDGGLLERVEQFGGGHHGMLNVMDDKVKTEVQRDEVAREVTSAEVQGHEPSAVASPPPELPRSKPSEGTAYGLAPHSQAHEVTSFLPMPPMQILMQQNGIQHPNRQALTSSSVTASVVGTAAVAPRAAKMDTINSTSAARKAAKGNAGGSGKRNPYVYDHVQQWLHDASDAALAPTVATETGQGAPMVPTTLGASAGGIDFSVHLAANV